MAARVATTLILVSRGPLLGASLGLVSGFFGIGGGFLIVPGLMLAAEMDIAEATGASLIAVLAFGLS